jgi:thymidylate kinase
MTRVPTHRWSRPHASILRDYFKSLDDAGIRFFVLRNHSGLPDVNPSKDVDLVIEPGSYAAAATKLVEEFRRHQLEYYHVARFERVRCWIGMSLSDETYIHIDLMEGYSNKGFEPLDFVELYEHTQVCDGFRALTEPYDAVMLLLYKLIGTRSLGANYRADIRDKYGRSPSSVATVLRRVLGDRLADLTTRLIEQDDFDAIEGYGDRIRSAFRIRTLLRAPFRTSLGICSFVGQKALRIVVRPRAHQKFIAFEAPDGAGKTTLIDEVVPKLAEAFVADREKVHVYHFRPGLLPNLGALGERVGLGEQDSDFENPHRRAAAGPLSSLVRIGYYWMDYVLGYQLFIRKDVQFERVSLFDRYAYGFLVDPLRSRVGLPQSVRTLFVRFCPKPDLVFMLFASPETIHSRKQELTLDEIRRQLVTMDNLAETSSRFIRIDAEAAPEAMASQVLRHVVGRYATKV